MLRGVSRRVKACQRISCDPPSPKARDGGTRCEWDEMGQSKQTSPQGLKPASILRLFAARLKSCPFTMGSGWLTTGEVERVMALLY